MSRDSDPMHGPRDDANQGDGRPDDWTDWYEFAGDELGLADRERVEYANRRYVEDQNRALLRARDAARTTRRSSGRRRPRFHS